LRCDFPRPPARAREALIETGLPFEAIHVDLGTKRLATGEDFALAPLTFRSDCVLSWYGTRRAAGPVNRGIGGIPRIAARIR
jgi:hypothetical protein